jgi:hypothetical protein
MHCNHSNSVGVARLLGLARLLVNYVILSLQILEGVLTPVTAVG